ncbi:hypothetical protein Q6D67_12110 [Haliea sp. E1-2-M8]|uniref:hypothetical protein n=1 Tax=Haliea sp. E1-2-M8 TaxID=3064706 RepID=UPI00271C3733|nr:hypothetical protein [Haliea sp. E1-2-M8]MDO8862445.1 hypothetical protein [Haliea sp. E1-2-M8]
MGGDQYLVGLTDVADIVCIYRQAMRKLMLAHRATFPLPVHEGSVSLSHLTEVLDWLKTRGGYEFDAGVLEAARVALAPLDLTISVENQKVNHYG